MKHIEFLKNEEHTLLWMLSQIPEENVIDIQSLSARLERVRAEIEEIENE